MGKVSIGLRGWRFDEDDVFDADGQLRPVDEMPREVRRRMVRLQQLVEAPCDACWLIHGDGEIQRCRVARAVYGEPLNEVVLCDEHERDFAYWFHEDGGSEHAGTDDFEDAFHEWFLDGNRAPEGYGGIEHVETDPDRVPDPESGPASAFDQGAGDDGDADTTGDDTTAAETDAGDAEDDLDLSMDYPRKR